MSKSRGNGQGTAYRRGPTWTSRVVIGWKLLGDPPHKCPVYATKGGFRTKRDALAYCDKLLSGIEKPRIAPSLEHYWDTYKAGKYMKLSASKQTAYTIAWDKMSSIRLRPVDVLTVADLQALIAKKAPTYYPARDMKVLLTHLYRIAAAEGWVSQSLPDLITLPALNETERLPFTEDEQTALWTAYEHGCMDAAIPLIMIYTGMMTGEMRRLKVEMIDFDNKKIVGVGLKTKVRKESAVYFPSQILPVLQDVTANRIGLVWPISEDEFYRRYYNALSMAGCRKLTPYSCRHTTATALAVTENIAPQTIKKLMRWSTTRMLDRYAHPDDDAAAAAIESLNRKDPAPEQTA